MRNLNIGTAAKLKNATSRSKPAGNNQRRISATTTVLAGLALMATWSLRDTAAPIDSGLTWWHLALLYVAAEVFVVRIDFRDSSYAISLAEAVTVIGLVLVNPLGVIVGRTLGTVAALSAQAVPPRKLIFNLALFLIETSVSAVAVHQWYSRAGVNDDVWLVAAGAVLVAAVIGSIIVSEIIRLSEEKPQKGLLPAINLVSIVASAGTVATTGLAAAAIEHNLTNATFFVVVMGCGYLVLRAQSRVSQQVGDLKASGDFTAALETTESIDDVLRVSVCEAARLLRADRAVIVNGEDALVYHNLSDSNGPSTLVQKQSPPRFLDEIPSSSRVRFFSDLELPAIDDPEPLDESSDDFGDVGPATAGMIGYLDLGDRKLAFCLIGRKAAQQRFTAAELDLFERLLLQSQIALRRAALIRRLEHDAHHDLLTGLTNRLGFRSQIANHHVIGTDARIDTGTLLLLDLDRFKEVNDTIGHPTGDRVLQLIAQRLERVAVAPLTLARLGGDEFAVFSPSSDPSEAINLAEQITSAIENPIRIDELSLQIGSSIGIAIAPEHGNDITTLMSRADVAMYVAKAQHRGWQFYRDEDDTNSPRRLGLLPSLRSAITNGELDVWYQPKVNTQTGKVSGLEALARWRHARHGQISPDEFIAIAEGAGLMRDLTDAVLKRTMEHVAAWDRQGIAVPVAINLSTRNLMDDTLPQRIADMALLGGIDPRLLTFEVTETAIMHDRDRVTNILNDLRDRGFRLAIDDYGTGYSSLSYLQELPVNTLKIDRAFITHLDTNEHNRIIVQSTIDLGHNLGLEVVGEGVERQAEWDTLKRFGCDHIQGYFISRPLPPAKMDRWLADQGTQRAEILDHTRGQRQQG